MAFINQKILETQPDRIEILGDLFHTHSIVRLEVMEFWDNWIDVLLSHEKDLLVLIGNHDRATPKEHAYSALHMFKHIKNKHLHIVDLARVEGIYAYIPWYEDQEKFVDLANNCADKYGAKVLVCHQTFDGSHYENGFYAPDGIDAKRLNYELIVSGHIHTKQDISKDGKRILYPGTPKWDTISDANQEKGVWLYEHDDVTGKIIKEEFFSVAGTIEPIIELTWIEGQDLPTIPSGARVTIELVGSSAWIDGHKANLKGHVAIKSRSTDRADRKDRQVGNSFEDFVTTKFDTKLDRKELLAYMKEKKIV